MTRKQRTCDIRAGRRHCSTLTWNKSNDIESSSVADWHPGLPLPRPCGIELPLSNGRNLLWALRHANGARRERNDVTHERSLANPKGQRGSRRTPCVSKSPQRRLLVLPGRCHRDHPFRSQQPLAGGRPLSSRASVVLVHPNTPTANAVNHERRLRRFAFATAQTCRWGRGRVAVSASHPGVRCLSGDWPWSANFWQC